jgi:hypothetical protein
MERLWKIGLDELVLWLPVLMILVAVACYVAERIRPKTEKKERAGSQWLSKCRDLHSRGGLSDEEFRTIKTTFAAQLRAESSHNGNSGGSSGAKGVETAGWDDSNDPVRRGFWKRLQDWLGRRA